jgi:hypothetical protein
MKKFVRAAVLAMVTVLAVLSLAACGGKLEGKYVFEEVTLNGTMPGLTGSVSVDVTYKPEDLEGATLDLTDPAKSTAVAYATMSFEFADDKCTMSVKVSGVEKSGTLDYTRKGDTIAFVDGEGNDMLAALGSNLTFKVSGDKLIMEGAIIKTDAGLNLTFKAVYKKQ